MPDDRRAHARGGNRRDRHAGARGQATEALPVVVGDWTLFFHPLFLDQLERLTAAAEAETERVTEQAAKGGQPSLASERLGPNVKLLAAVQDLMLVTIPEKPTRKEYRQGGTLGDSRKHWFRAKFGGGRFRLFFRFRADVSVLVFAWMNDEHTLRTYGSSTDAYRTFARMLGQGHPPDDWDALLLACQDRSAIGRGSAAVAKHRAKKSSRSD